MSAKNYVIVRIAHEYNDEIYEQKDGGGIPEKIFTDKLKADGACLAMNAEVFAGLRPAEYCYDSEDIMSRSKIWDQFNSIDSRFKGINGDNYQDLEIPEKLSLDKLIEVAKFFDKLNFFEVYEVDSE